MTFKIIPQCKSFPANVTFERLLSSVRDFVLIETLFVPELFSANFTSMLIKLFILFPVHSP
jgi:hypothetical protein